MSNSKSESYERVKLDGETVYKKQEVDGKILVQKGERPNNINIASKKPLIPANATVNQALQVESFFKGWQFTVPLMICLLL